MRERKRMRVSDWSVKIHTHAMQTFTKFTTFYITHSVTAVSTS